MHAVNLALNCDGIPCRQFTAMTCNDLVDIAGNATEIAALCARVDVEGWLNVAVRYDVLCRTAFDGRDIAQKN